MIKNKLIEQGSPKKLVIKKETNIPVEIQRIIHN